MMMHSVQSNTLLKLESKMVTLTREDVARVARALITLNGTTTTLDVKNALRRLGFWAKQADVRYFMLDITSKDGDIKYDDSNGMYRVYSFVTPFPDTPEPEIFVPHEFITKDRVYFGPIRVCKKCGCSERAATHFGWGCDKSDRDTDLVVKTRVKDGTGSYEVRDRYGYYPRIYHNVTRGQAKHQWAMDTGGEFFTARTKRLD